MAAAPTQGGTGRTTTRFLHRAARSARIACTLAAFAVAGGASADVGVNKSFAPNTVSAGQTSTLTIVFLNPNPASATGTTVTDTLPGTVVVASPANVATTCGGTVTATPGAATVNLSGATVPAAIGATPGQCQFSVSVVSNSPGTFVNTLPVNAVASSQGSNTQAAQATLVTTALSNITGTKAFAPTNVHAGGSAALMTITLTNPNGVALTNAAFTDTFPANVILNTPPGLGTTCAGGTVTGVAGGSSVQLAGATIPASGSCTVTASVITGNPNTALNVARTNTIAAGGVTTSQGVTNPAISGNLTVQSGAALGKVFAPTTIASGNAATLTITVSNFNATALAGITFTDTFPGTMVVANPANASTTCGGTVTATPGAGSINLNGGSLTGAPAGATARTCTIVVSVTATNGGASAQTLTNTLAAGTFGTVNYTGGSANLIVNPSSPITGTKTYSPAPVQSGTTTATVTLTNTTGAAATITSFTDNLTTLGAGFTVGSSPAPGGTCAATISAPVGGTLVTASGGSIPAGGSCTITFPIAIAMSTATGGHTNTIAAGAVQTTQGGNTLPITGVVDLARAFTSTKTFTPTTVQMGTKAQANVTFTHNANAVPLSNLSFTDTLPAGHVIASPANPVNSCGGTLTATPGAGSFSLTGGALGAGATSCSVLVNVLTPSSVGVATNSIAAGAVTTAEGATNAVFSANLTRVNTSVTINKSFTPATVAVGGTSQIAVQIRNNNANAIQLTSGGLIDTLPTGLTPANPTGLAMSGTGCSFTSSGFGPGVWLIGGMTINAGSVCTVTINVKPTAAGNLINSLPIGIITNAQNVTNPAVATATLASSGTAFLSIAKSNGVATLTPGGTTTYTVTVGNTGPNDVAGLSVDDTPPAGVTFTSWSCAATAGSLCTASGSGAIADAVTLLNGGTLTYTVNAAIAPGASGTIANTVSLGVPGSVIDTNPVSSATDTDPLVPVTALSLTKTDGSSVYVPGGTGTYVVTLTNAGPSDALNVTVADSLPAGVTLAGNVTCIAANGASCGTVSGATGATSFGATSAVVPAGGGSQLTFNVPVAFAAGMGAASITNTVTAVDGPSGGSAGASDTDTRAPQVSLTAGKTDGSATYVPGTNGTYTVVIGNTGVSSALGVTVADPLPSGVTLSSAASCAATAGSSCGVVAGVVGATSAGAVGATLAPGGSLTFTLPVHFGAAMTAASITNTVSATDASSGASVSASDVDSRVAQVALAATKSDGSASYTPGSTATYVITLTNAGPTDALGVAISDPLPTGVTLDAPAGCVATGGASCGTVTGSAGATSVSVANAMIPAGGGNALTLTLPVRFAAGLASDPLVNAVSVTDVPTGATASASDSDARAPGVALSITKSDAQATYTPGGNATYTIVVTNAGPSDATDVSVTDALPAGVSLSTNATCVASGGAACGTVTGAAGATAFGTTGASIPAGAANALTFSIPVAFAASLTADPLVNSVSAVDAPSGATASASDSDTLARAVALAVSKSDGSATYTPGGTAVYTIVVTNAGPSDAASVTVTDALPAGVTLTAAPGCIATGNAACGTLSGAIGQTSFGATLARVGAGAGDALTFTVPVAFAAGLATDPLVNTASAIDAVTGNTAAGSDSDARSLAVSLAVAKTDGSSTYMPGGSATYTVTVTNGGISDALDVTVSDALPAGVALTGTVTCAASGNAACGTPTGSAAQTSFGTTGARVGAGAGNAIALSAPVAFAPGLATDPLVNTADALDVPSGATGSGSDTNGRLAQVSLAVTKSDGQVTYVPGGSATYVVQVTNTGASDALDVTVTDGLPTGVTLDTTVTCAVTGSASCGTVVGSAGQSAFGATAARIAAGAGNALTFSVPVRYAASLLDDPLVNTAGATDQASGASGSGSDSDARVAQVGLTLTKSDGSATYTPGGGATYTVILGNAGPSDARDVTLTDALPAGVALSGNVACVPSGAATCGTVSGASGATTFTLTGAHVPAGGANLLTLTAPVAFGPSMTTDPLVNAVQATDVPSGASASATDSDALSSSVSLAVTKSDGSATYTPGGTAVYTISVTNGGASDATAVTISDPLPPGVTLTGAATCVASGTSSCGSVSGAAGQASVTATGARVAAGAGNAVVLTVPVVFAPGLAANPLVNTATALDAPSGAAGSGSDSDALAAAPALTLAKTDNASTYVPGGGATYVVTIGNIGLSNAGNVTMTDNLPAGVTLSSNATCVASGSATCGTLSGAAGATAVTLSGGAIAAGGGNALTISIPVRFDAAMLVDPLVNSVGATATGGAPVTATDTDTRAATTGLTLAKTDNKSTYTPGDQGTYVLTLGNAGPSNASAIVLTDPLPAGMTLRAGTTCVALGTATCGTLSAPVGGSTMTMSGASVSAGAGNQLIVSVPVRYAASLRVDPLVNSATATAPGSAAVSATDSDALDIRAALVLTKTDNRASYTPGTTGTYVIRLTNTGVSDATNVQVNDNLPAGVTLAGAPTCVATGSASCGTLMGSAGVIAFAASGATIAAGSGNALDYSVPVRFGSAMTIDPLVNTASASADGGTSAQSSDSDLRNAPAAPLDIPVGDVRALALLALLLGALALLRLRRR